jgi:hypothetical protein
MQQWIPHAHEGEDLSLDQYVLWTGEPPCHCLDELDSAGMALSYGLGNAKLQ